MPKTLLPDINVWLALAFDGHVHHELARAWFEAITDERCFFCRLAVLVNPGAVDEAGLVGDTEAALCIRHAIECDVKLLPAIVADLVPRVFKTSATDLSWTGKFIPSPPIRDYPMRTLAISGNHKRPQVESER